MKKNKVLFFKPLINFILNHARTILWFIILAISILSFPWIYENVKNFFQAHKISISNFQEELFTAILSAALPLFYTFLLGLHKRWRKWIINLKRFLYCRIFWFVQSESTPFCIKKLLGMFIRVFYYQKREIINEQQNIIDKILNDLNCNLPGESTERIFWVQGSPYSGKTTTILNMFIDLISKNNYQDLFEQLDGKIAYYDLGNENTSSKQLMKDYSLGKFENFLLVIDNIHKINNEDCFDIIQDIVINKRIFAIIVLLRNSSEFMYDNAQIDKLNKIIYSKGNLYSLSEITEKNFSIQNKVDFEDFCKQFHLERNDYTNNAIMVHFASVYLKTNKKYPKILFSIKDFLNGTCSQEIFQTQLICAVAASIFTGSFSISVLQKCYEESNSTWRCFLQQLENIGLINNSPNSQIQYYYFHENLAKFYFEKTFIIPEYKHIYLDCFLKLSQYYYGIQNHLLAFLYSVLLPKNNFKYLFDTIIINANFLILYQEIQFLINFDVRKEKMYYRELGILCDRIGNLSKAKEYYLEFLKQEKSPEAFYKLVQIDHDYIHDYPDIVKKAHESTDYYYVLLCVYWEIHVEMHNGIFNFNSLKTLLATNEQRISEVINKHPYDGLHLLRRIYFDLFRVYYLAGILEPSELKIAISDSNPITRLLSARLNEFDAYYTKFAVAQFLDYDIIFSLAFKHKGISNVDYDLMLANHITIKHEQTHDVKLIALESIKLYSNAIAQLEEIGDKTAIFIKYHMYGVKLMLVEDGDFSECEQFYETYMAFATRENDVEYQAYAELYKLKMLLIKINSPVIIGFEANYQDLINQAYKKIELAKTYQKLCNVKKGNVYATIRLQLLETLLHFSTQIITLTQFRQKIKEIKNICQKQNYKRELTIIEYIKACEYNPSHENIRIIVTYYPIVTQ